MSTQVDGQFTLAAGGTVAAYRLVKNSSGAVVLNTAVATDVPMGVCQPANSYASEALVAVRDIKGDGTHKVTAAGAITKGATIYAAADGKVQALPAVAGTYRNVGVALEAASGNNSIIECWLTPQGDTDTVSGS